MSKPKRRCQRCKVPVSYTVATNDHLCGRCYLHVSSWAQEAGHVDMGSVKGARVLECTSPEWLVIVDMWVEAGSP